MEEPAGPFNNRPNWERVSGHGEATVVGSYKRTAEPVADQTDRMVLDARRYRAPDRKLNGRFNNKTEPENRSIRSWRGGPCGWFL